MQPQKPVGVGVVGAGFISDQYLANMTTYPDLDVVSVGDLFPDRARAQAEKYGVRHWGSPSEVIDHPEVEIVVNITVLAAHYEIASQALAADKHVWNEKPLAGTLAEGRALVDDARARGLLLGCAPDTFLGPGMQTVLRLLADGAIGTPLTANAIMQNPGPDRWHPDPAFVFADVGPLFDLAPYYFTMLSQVFGEVSDVSALASTARDVRHIHTGPRAGETFPVTVPTHTAALLGFAGGGQAQAMFSYDTEVQREGFLEITGTEGTLVAPDPNHFDGEVRVLRNDGTPPTTHPTPGAGSGRGVGTLDMARALRTGSPVRATGELGLYIQSVMDAVAHAARDRSIVRLDTPFVPSALLPTEWNPLEATL